jgi:hypothetical protein
MLQKAKCVCRNTELLYDPSAHLLKNLTLGCNIGRGYRAWGWYDRGCFWFRNRR